MKAICHLIRFLGLLMGLFLLASSIANALGLVPYSHETPAWSVRLVSSAPSMLVGMVLLIPNRHFLSERKFIALMCAYGAITAWALAKAMSGLAAYAAGGKHWGLVAASVIPPGIILANAAVLAIRRFQTAKLPR